MAQKPAKMGHNKGGKVQAGEKVNHRVEGNPLTGYVVMNAEGEPITNYENMWDAINYRKRLDSKG